MAIPPILKGSILNDSYYTPSAARVQPENGRKQKDVIRHHVDEFYRTVESAKKNENQTSVFTFHDLYGIIRFLYKGIIIKHNKTEPTYTKTSLFLCEKRRFFMARTEKGVVATI